MDRKDVRIGKVVKFNFWDPMKAADEVRPGDEWTCGPPESMEEPPAEAFDIDDYWRAQRDILHFRNVQHLVDNPAAEANARATADRYSITPEELREAAERLASHQMLQMAALGALFFKTNTRVDPYDTPRFEGTTRAEAISFNEMAEHYKTDLPSIEQPHEIQHACDNYLWWKSQRLDSVRSIYFDEVEE